MPYVLRGRSPLLVLLIIFCSSLFVKCRLTSIEGIVKSRGDEATWPLQNANLVLIIKSDTNHSDLHQLKLNLNQSSFPVHFILRNLNEIKRTDNYLLSLLIFGYPHRLLWEGILLREHLVVDRTNTLTFIVQDVSNTPRCLLQGHPCIESQIVPDPLVSTCCTGARCERSVNPTQDGYSCGGKPPVLLHANMTFAVPRSIAPRLGSVSQDMVELIRITLQAISVPGDLIIIKRVYFDRVRSGTSEQSLEVPNDRYVMIIDALISTPAECQGKQHYCHTQTVNNIEDLQMSLVIDQGYGSPARLTVFTKPTINVVGMPSRASTVAVSSSLTSRAALNLSVTRLNTEMMTTVTGSRTAITSSETATTQTTPSSVTIITQTTVTTTTTTTTIATTTAITTTAVTTLSLRWNSTASTVTAVDSSPDGMLLGQISHPTGITLDSSDRLYVADVSYNRVQVYATNASNGSTVAGSNNESTAPDSNEETFDSSPSHLYWPLDVAVTLDGDIYVADAGNFRIMFWPFGASTGIQVVDYKDSYKDITDKSLGLCGVAFDSRTHTVYISDATNHRVISYAQNTSTIVTVAGGNGFGLNDTQLYSPRGLHFESSTNSLLIANVGANNIVRWTLGASHWTLIAGNFDGSSGTGSTELNAPSDVISDSMGNVYVADFGNQRVQFYLADHMNGTTIAGVTGMAGSDNVLFSGPWSVALDSQLNLYVADTMNYRVQKFQRY